MERGETKYKVGRRFNVELPLKEYSVIREDTRKVELYILASSRYEAENIAFNTADEDIDWTTFEETSVVKDTRNIGVDYRDSVSIVKRHPDQFLVKTSKKEWEFRGYASNELPIFLQKDQESESPYVVYDVNDNGKCEVKEKSYSFETALQYAYLRISDCLREEYRNE